MTDLNQTNNSDNMMLNDIPTKESVLDMINPNNPKDINDLLGNTSKNTTSNEMENGDSEKNTLPNIKIKLNETEPLSLKVSSKKDENQSSGVINIPKHEKKDKIERYISTENTLNESIVTTINRDLFLIYTKIKCVVNPFTTEELQKYHIKQWDLWGPLTLNMILAFTLSFNTKEKSQMTTLIFIIFWLGGLILYLNSNFLGVKASIFQILCLLGYCLFPLNISAIIVTLINFNDMIRLILVLITLFWSIYSSSSYLKAITSQEQRYLVLYPCILFYLYISWFIFTAKNK